MVATGVAATTIRKRFESRACADIYSPAIGAFAPTLFADTRPVAGGLGTAAVGLFEMQVSKADAALPTKTRR